jgi:hypothetical protein
MNKEEILADLERLNDKICATRNPPTDLEISINLLWQLIVCEDKEKEVCSALFNVLNTSEQ